MRLGQLARKLSLRPSQLVDLLTLNNIPTEEGSNTRLADEHTLLIVQHFAPGSLEEIMQPVEDVAEPESLPVAEAVISTEPDQSPEPVEEPVTHSEEPPVPSGEEQPESEVIRVQKIALSGLKVLGKIDLPEPKKKEPRMEDETPGEEPSKTRRNPPKSKHPKREQRNPRTWRNPVEAQRNRETREL
ncbi:MAG TPA: hypothetical protein VFM90_13515, partial [Cyclobacteriaceae bacterium]|nr:hypothetical protein [Cyclobacteriaceae bacterium]